MKNPDGPADPIIVHPDVRRMLMRQKVLNEGMRALALFAGHQLDLSVAHPEASARESADDLVQLLTPVVKSFLTDEGFNNANLGLQVLGGSGFTTDCVPISLFLIMLGMGLSLVPDDFRRVLAYPKAVAIGLSCQLVLLPLIGFGLANRVSLSPELAVGVMLLAVCPGGTTSNLHTHIAKGDFLGLVDRLPGLTLVGDNVMNKL